MSSGRGTELAARTVLAMSWAVAAALVAKGHAGAGDGFSAGMTAAAGTLLYVLAAGLAAARELVVVRHAGAVGGIGLALVLVPALAPLLLAEPPFTRVPPPGAEAPAAGILHFSSSLLLEVGVFAVVFALVLRTIELLGSVNGPREAR